MATTTGLVYGFSTVTLNIAGFEVDAFADGGFDVAWTGVQFEVATGASNNNILIRVGNDAATLTVNLMESSRFLDYATAWLLVRDPRPLSFLDGNGRTFMTAPRSIPEQQPGLTFNAGHSPRAIVILCPNLTGTVGGLNED